MDAKQQSYVKESFSGLKKVGLSTLSRQTEPFFVFLICNETSVTAEKS